MSEGLVSVAAQHVRACCHLLLADQEALVVALVALPRQPALEQEEKSVRERLEVVAARGRAAKMRVDRCIAHSPSEHVGFLVILDVCVAD